MLERARETLRLWSSVPDAHVASLDRRDAPAPGGGEDIAWDKSEGDAADTAPAGRADQPSALDGTRDRERDTEGKGGERDESGRSRASFANAAAEEQEADAAGNVAADRAAAPLPSDANNRRETDAGDGWGEDFTSLNDDDDDDNDETSFDPRAADHRHQQAPQLEGMDLAGGEEAGRDGGGPADAGASPGRSASRVIDNDEGHAVDNAAADDDDDFAADWPENGHDNGGNNPDNGVGDTSSKDIAPNANEEASDVLWHGEAQPSAKHAVGSKGGQGRAVESRRNVCVLCSFTVVFSSRGRRRRCGASGGGARARRHRPRGLCQGAQRRSGAGRAAGGGGKGA